MTKQEAPNQVGQKRAKVSQTEFPNITLEQAMRIAQAIWDNFAGKGAAPHNIAMAIDLSPTSGGWRNLCGSSIAYGLTEGGYNANQITLTELGRRIVAPIKEGDDEAARVDAVLQPRLEREFFQKYNKAKLPKDEIGQNVLVSMGLPKERVVQAFNILKENGAFTGIIRETKTGPFVVVDEPLPGADGQAPIVADEDPSNDGEAFHDAGPGRSELPASVVPKPGGPKQLFVAHGKNHKPLEDLKKILNEFKIPYKVAIDEPNKGRPISGKVVLGKGLPVFSDLAMPRPLKLMSSKAFPAGSVALIYRPA